MEEELELEEKSFLEANETTRALMNIIIRQQREIRSLDNKIEELRAHVEDIVVMNRLQMYI